ncbi:recombinase family protein [Parafrankia sp. FMc2]|uniref:recombinase family protein n=1 Tax=Parafrankia sp. FMc2 TaxID=3233196 RepID=UPI0034D56283
MNPRTVPVLFGTRIRSEQGVAHCREVFVETASTRGERPELRRALGLLRDWDTLVIYKPDRVARSMKELLVLLEDELHARGINLHILTGICAGLHRPAGATIADKMLFMAAETERELIRERTLDGLRAAEAAGRRGGRPVRVDEDTLAVVQARRARGESVSEIARRLGVGRSTVYRALQHHALPGVTWTRTLPAWQRHPARSSLPPTTAPVLPDPQVLTRVQVGTANLTVAHGADQGQVKVARSGTR